ncbi:MAG: response regulator [Lachnospiraceae bacterium]
MHIIYVDDEMPALDNFRLTVKDFPEIDSLHLFRKGEEALKWAEQNPVDTAFLDMEMQGIHGLELAKRLKKIDPNIRIIFVTAYDQYALKAFGVDAIGYVLKPYSRAEICKELEKAALMRSRPRKRVEIITIPDFVVLVDGKPLSLGRAKTEEMLALLVDHGDAGITVGEAIACLWPDRANDENTQSLYRVTFKRLMDALRAVEIDNIICSEGRKKYIVRDQVECDLYRILEGDMGAIRKYAGRYMSEYSWAEERNAQLNNMKDAKA